jgi:two-component system sensor histidine kinase HydH
VAEQPLEIALREVGRLDGVVRGVLELGRLRPPQPVRTDLSKLAAEAADVVAGQAAECGVKVEQVSSAGANRVELDPDQVRAAILNLVLNALEAVPPGGTIRLVASEAGTRARLAISDSGPGIPQERRAEIFRPFVTGKEHGTGLGLPLAKRAIEDNGGTLVLEEGSSQLGGAEFTLTFARAETA